MDSVTEDILYECSKSTKMCAKVLFPHFFYREFSSVHDDIFSVCDDDTIEKLVITAFRGCGKTTTLTLAMPARKLLFDMTNFLVLVSATADLAIQQSENLKMELLTNDVIKGLFGDVRVAYDKDGAETKATFSTKRWITGKDQLVFPRGAGQQIRGTRHGRFRPDTIIVDDLEDPEHVDSEEQRAKTKKWFFADLSNCIDRGETAGSGSHPPRIVVVGTVLHELSLLVELIENPEFVHVNLPLCDDDMKSVWPDFMSDTAVKKLVETYRIAGDLDIFAREFMNQPISKEDASFQQSMFRYYDEGDTVWQKALQDTETVVIVDPAKTVKAHSDDSAIVAVGVDPATHRIFVRDVDAGKYHPDELMHHAMRMCDRFRSHILGVEVTSLNEHITFPWQNEIFRSGRSLELVELKARMKKEDRIKMLVPYYRQGLVLHNASACNQLEVQLVSFPRGRRDDVADALAYIPQLLSMGDRYFMVKGDDIESAASIEREYETLMKDDEPALAFVSQCP